jgi:hypothetical protein
MNRAMTRLVYVLSSPTSSRRTTSTSRRLRVLCPMHRPPGSLVCRCRDIKDDTQWPIYDRQRFSYSPRPSRPMVALRTLPSTPLLPKALHPTSKSEPFHHPMDVHPIPTTIQTIRANGDTRGRYVYRRCRYRRRKWRREI